MSIVTGKRVALSEAMVEFAKGKYLIQTSPRALWWFDWFKDYCEAYSIEMPAWANRMTADVRKHFRQHRKSVRDILTDQCGLVVTFASNRLKRYVNHGNEPTRDDRFRTDDWYRSCVPSPRNPTVAFVTFPRATASGHPLIIAYLAGVYGPSVSRLRRAHRRVDEAYLREVISKEDMALLTHDSIAALLHEIQRTDRPLLEN